MKTKELVKYIEKMNNAAAIKIGKNSKKLLIASEAFVLDIYGFDKAVDNLASIFHENWRKDFIRKNGDIPRIKNANDGTDRQININDKFTKLSDFWKEDNRKAAKFALKLYLVYGGNMSDEKMGSLIHEYWKERNSWENIHKKDEYGNELPFLFSLYRNLPDEEKEKDINHIRLADYVLSEIYTYIIEDQKQWDQPDPEF